MSGEAIRKVFVEETRARLVRLIREGESIVSDAFLESVGFIRDRQTLAELEELITTGRVEDALSVVDETWQRVANSSARVYVQSAEATSRFISNELGVIADFNQTNTRAVAQMASRRLDLVREFTAEQRTATRQALTRSIRAGSGPRTQARAFRDSIGLTARQEDAVANYRSLLETGSREALGRKLRDRRFDPSIIRSIENNEPLSEAQINRMVARYRERTLKHRSEVIARTESLQAVHQGTGEMYEQAIEQGAIDGDSLMRTWVPANDERVRTQENSATSHESMRGQQRGINEPFESGAGNQALWPGGFGVAEDDIQCRCVVTTRFAAPDS